MLARVIPWWADKAPASAWACECDRLTIAWRPRGAGVTQRGLLRCKSRQHPGECQKRWRQQLWSRLHASELRRAPKGSLVFLTLTLPGDEHGDDINALHRSMGERWNRLRGELVREYGERVESIGPTGRKRVTRRPIPYVWVRESHKSGVPHFHCVLISKALADAVREAERELATMGAETGDWKAIAPARVRELAVRCGFGSRCDASIVRTRAAIDNYISKVCGEITKPTQFDFVPEKTKCFGASRGILPARHKSDATGWLEASDSPGVPLVRAPHGNRDAYPSAELYAEAIARAESRARARLARGAVETDCVAPSEPLAYWQTTKEALAWAHAPPPDSAPVRTYTLKRELVYTPPAQDTLQAST